MATRRIKKRARRGDLSSGEGPSSRSRDWDRIHLFGGNAEAQAKFEKYKLNTMAINRCMDYEAMDLLGVREEVLALAEVGHFSRLLGIHEEAYHPLTLEFVCSLRTEPPIILNDLPRLIKFRLNDEPRTLTLDQFSLFMELYTVPEITSPAHSQLVYRTDTFPYQRLWREWSDDPKEYDPSKSKASHLRSHALRYLHRVMVHSVLSRGDGEGGLQKRDFFYLACMVAGRDMHLSHGLLCYLVAQTTLSVRTRTFGCGPYVTRLARNMGIWDDLPPMMPSGAWKPVGKTTIRKMKLWTDPAPPAAAHRRLQDDEDGDRAETEGGDSEGDDGDDQDDDSVGEAPRQPSARASTQPHLPGSGASRAVKGSRHDRTTRAPGPAQLSYEDPRFTQMMERIDLISFNQRMIMQHMGIPYYSSIPPPGPDTAGPSYPPPDAADDED